MAGRPLTQVKKFAQKYNLGDAIYGCFYQAEYDEYSEELKKVLYGWITRREFQADVFADFWITFHF